MCRFLFHWKTKFIKPFQSGYLPEKDGHQIFFMQVGNPDGIPVLCFHGGPGSGAKIRYASAFDLKKYHVILFDQRGCGRSLYKKQLHKNTPHDTMDDARRLLDFLHIKKVIAFGGSYGATCATLFAITHPQYVQKLIVHSVFLGRPQDSEKLSPTVALFYPDIWAALQQKTEQKDLNQYFYRLMISSKQTDIQKAMHYYHGLESISVTGPLNPTFSQKTFSPQDTGRFRIFMHYQTHKMFLKENEVLIGAKKIKVPTLIYQNRLDFCCPAAQAFELHQAIKGSRFIVLPHKGHCGEALSYRIYQDSLTDFTVKG